MNTLHRQWDSESLASADVYSQCRTCRYRDRSYIDTSEDDNESDWSCWEKDYCQKFGQDWVLSQSDIIVPYFPEAMEDKPTGVMDGTTECECYCQETRIHDDIVRTTKKSYEMYRELYRKYYNDLNDNGVPMQKDRSIENVIWSRVKTLD